MAGLKIRVWCIYGGVGLTVTALLLLPTLFGDNPDQAVSGSGPMTDVSADAVQRIYEYEGPPHTDRSGQVRTTYDPNSSFFPRGIYYPEPCRGSQPFAWPAFTDSSHPAYFNFKAWSEDTKYRIRLHMGTQPKPATSDFLITEYDVPGTQSGNQSAIIDEIPAGVDFYYEVFPNPWQAFLFKTPLAQGTFQLACDPSDPDDPNVVATLANADFNSLVTGSTRSTDPTITARIQHPKIYSDLKASAGVQDFAFIVNGQVGCEGFPYQLFDPISQGGQGYGQHPDILGWQLEDEPLHRAAWQNDVACFDPPVQCNFSEMQMALNRITTKYNTLAPETDQVIFAVEATDKEDSDRTTTWPPGCDPTLWEQFIDAGDVANHDNYLSWNELGVPYDSTYLIGQSVSHQTNAVAQTEVLDQLKPSWFTVYAASFEDNNCGGQCGYPSPARTRAAVYTAIVHGATGIWYFAWDSFFIHPGIRPPGEIPYSYPENPSSTASSSLRQDGGNLWLEIADINSELASLESILLQPTRTNYRVLVPQSDVLAARGSCAQNCSPIHAMMKSSLTENKRYIFAVNMENYSVDLELRLPMNIQGVVDYGDQAPIPFSLNTIPDQLAAFEAKIYEITIDTSPDGLYEISHEFAGEYQRCMGAVTGTTSLSMRVYCYTDIFGKEINPEGYPGAIGDGLPGAPPPGPETSPGSGNLVYGDVNAAHTVLTGSLVGTKVSLSGCFEDLDVSDPLGDIYVEWTWNVQTGAGTSKTWTGQCNNSGASGDGALQAIKLATTAQMNACYTTDPLCPYADNDPPEFDRNVDGVVNALDSGDGMPDHLELNDDSVCGRRDPFNPNDYYDVGGSGSTALDGSIDLFNDIVGVINNYDPDGLAAGGPAISGPGNIINYDRPSKIAGNSGTWNRGSPDGVIDLFQDISGVIAQYNPDGVNASACQ